MHTYTQAIQIFEAKADREVRDTLAASVAARFGITAKAVRDIWNLRTAFAVMPNRAATLAAKVSRTSRSALASKIWIACVYVCIFRLSI